MSLTRANGQHKALHSNVMHEPHTVKHPHCDQSSYILYIYTPLASTEYTDWQFLVVRTFLFRCYCSR